MNNILKNSLMGLKISRDSVIASSEDVENFIDNCGKEISSLFPQEKGQVNPASPRYKVISRLSAHILPKTTFYHATDERSVVMTRLIVTSKEGGILMGQYPSHHIMAGKWDIFSARSDVTKLPNEAAESILRERYGLRGKVTRPPFLIRRYDIETENETCVDVLELSYMVEAYASIDPGPRNKILNWRWLQEKELSRSHQELSLIEKDKTFDLLKAAFNEIRRINLIKKEIGDSYKKIGASIIDSVR